MKCSNLRSFFTPILFIANQNVKNEIRVNCPAKWLKNAIFYCLRGFLCLQNRLIIGKFEPPQHTSTTNSECFLQLNLFSINGNQKLLLKQN
jgi:hypothetical protein